MTTVDVFGTPSTGLKIHDVYQGSVEWHAARCGLLTASEMNLIITPTLKMASNEKERNHLWELCAQRISKYVEPSYIGADMLRGYDDEVEARKLYAKNFAPIREVGFITNDKWGYTLGYSPDALVGDDGAIEVKSRRQKYQIETITTGQIDPDYAIQLQTGMLVAELQWIDFISYSGGLPMFVQRVRPDTVVQAAILNAAGEFEKRMVARITEYDAALKAMPVFIETERRIEEMYTT